MRASFIFLVLFAGFLFAGCLGQPPQPAVNETVSPPVTPPVVQPPLQANETAPILEGCAGKPLAEARDACYFAEGRTGNVSACEQIENVLTRNNCFHDAARALNASGICENIRNYAEKVSCIEEITPPCTGLENESKAVCLAKRYNDASKCGEYGDACVYAFAVDKLNLSACALVFNNVKKYACQAFVSNDLAYCYTPQATDNTTRDACFENVARAKNDSTICAYTVTRLYINLCYEYFALSFNDASLCARKYDEMDRDDCHAALARKTGNASLCALIESGFVNKTLTDVCYNDVAKNTGNPSACSGIKRDYHRYNCYATVIEGGEYEFGKAACDAIPSRDYQWKDNCYYRLVRKGGDKSLCASIQDEALKATCES